MRRPIAFVTVLIAGLGLVAGTGFARSGGAVPERLAGAWDTYFPSSDPAVRNHWVLAFGKSGSFVYTTPSLVTKAAGPVSVDGSTITFPPDVARGGPCSTPGIYTWNLTGKTLTFSRVDDSCYTRSGRLTKRPWTRFTTYSIVVIVKH
jgi:hypothetical protein